MGEGEWGEGTKGRRDKETARLFSYYGTVFDG